MVNVAEEPAIALAQQVKAQGITQEQLVCRTLKAGGVPMDPLDLSGSHTAPEGNMSASIVHLAELENVRTDQLSTTEPAASEDEARRHAEDAIRQKPNLRLIRITRPRQPLSDKKR